MKSGYRTFFFVLFVLIGQSAYPQVGKLIIKIDTSANFVTADNLDNAYFITSKNELLKFSPAGKLLWRYSNKTAGKPAYADTSDPMRILLFYPDIQQIQILNNNLNEIARYAFRDIRKQVTLVASANTNGYWYFEQANFELHKVSNDFTDILQSGNIYQQTGKAIQADFIQANAQYVYLHDPRNGLLQFDRFGAYIKTIAAGSLSYFQAKEEFIWYVKDSSLWRLNSQTYAADTFPLPPGAPLKQVSIGNKIIAMIAGNSVYLYAFEAKPPKG